MIVISGYTNFARVIPELRQGATIFMNKINEPQIREVIRILKEKAEFLYIASDYVALDDRDLRDRIWHIENIIKELKELIRKMDSI